MATTHPTHAVHSHGAPRTGGTTRTSGGKAGRLEDLTDDPVRLLAQKPSKSAYPLTPDQQGQCLAEWRDYAQGREPVGKLVVVLIKCRRLLLIA